MVAESSSRKDVKYSEVASNNADTRSTTIPGEGKTSTKYSKKKQVFATVCATLGCLLNGAVIGYTGPAIPSLIIQSEGGNNDPSVWGDPLQMTFQTASWITGILSVGCFVGCLIAGPTMDKLGRKKTLMIVTSGNFIIGFLLIILANSSAVVLAGRFVNGMGLGFILAVVSVYIVEIASTDMRGFLGCFVQFLGSIGVLITFSLGAVLNWWQLAIANLVMVLPFIVGMIFAPESPRWLISKGDENGGKEALKWLRGSQPETIANEIEQIKAEIAEKEKERVSISMLAAPDVLKPFTISLAMMFFLQMSGSNVMVFYCNTIFALAGSSIEPSYASIIIGFVLLGSCFVALAVVSKLNRKIMLVSSMLGMAICYFVLGACLFDWNKNPMASSNQFNQTSVAGNSSSESTVQSPSSTSSYGWVSILAVIGIVFCGNGGYGTLIWVVTAELLPSKVRSIANSIIICFAFVIGFIVSKTFADLLESIDKSGTFWMYGSICLVGAIFTAICVPETRGKSIEEIQAYFSKGKKDESLEEARLDIVS